MGNRSMSWGNVSCSHTFRQPWFMNSPISRSHDREVLPVTTLDNKTCLLIKTANPAK